MTSAEATELRDEVLNSIADFDAQRLRADTAEAELDGLRYKAELYDEVWADATGRGYANVTMALCALTAAEQRIAKMEAALKYYADKDHFSTDDGLNWDNCSGEPSNILWHEEQPWFIEDGSIARAALNPKPEGEIHE